MIIKNTVYAVNFQINWIIRNFLDKIYIKIIGYDWFDSIPVSNMSYSCLEKVKYKLYDELSLITWLHSYIHFDWGKFHVKWIILINIFIISSKTKVIYLFVLIIFYCILQYIQNNFFNFLETLINFQLTFTFLLLFI